MYKVHRFSAEEEANFTRRKKEYLEAKNRIYGDLIKNYSFKAKKYIFGFLWRADSVLEKWEAWEEKKLINGYQYSSIFSTMRYKFSVKESEVETKVI